MQGLVVVGLIFQEISNIKVKCVKVTGVQNIGHLFVCVEVLRPSQPNGVMLSAVSLPNRTFTGQA